MKKSVISILLTASLVLTLCGCTIKINTVPEAPAEENTPQTSDFDKEQEGITAKETYETIRIISTSDMHGKMIGYDYIADQEDLSGSVAQVASALTDYRDDNTILVDIGDTTQDNLAELFVDEDVHPMMQAINAIGYDICVIGNHEFNHGVEFAKKYINSFKGDFLLGNVHDEDNNPLAKPYTIIEKNGVRIAFIGMVSPNIENWDTENLKGYLVTDPAQETNWIINELEEEGLADLYVGVYHMDDEDELENLHSGFASLSEACPRLNLILGAHGHTLINQNYANNIPACENLNAGRSIQIADITVRKVGDNVTVKEIKTMPVETADYPEDPDIVKLLAPYDVAAKEYTHTPIGELVGGPLADEFEIPEINAALMGDSALQTLVQDVMLYYSDADVSASCIASPTDNALAGTLTFADASKIYKYPNTLYTVSMSGAQLKKYMEWAASFYQQYKEGDLIVAFEDTPVYNYDTFGGVKYIVDISKPVGERIVNLTDLSGKPIADDDPIILAVNNYRATSALTVPGVIFEENELPKIEEKDVCGNIGNIRMLIVDYIKNVKNGTITPYCDNNWSLIGTDWDEGLHQEAVDAINNGTLKLTPGAKSNPCISKITIEDLLATE